MIGEQYSNRRHRTVYHRSSLTVTGQRAMQAIIRIECASIEHHHVGLSGAGERLGLYLMG
jgi:hypothetical protein